MKNKGRFWRAKASLFGRESVAAFLVGDLGCAYRDHRQRRFSIGCSLPRPAHHSVSRRGRGGGCQSGLSSFVASTRVVPSCQQAPPNRYSFVTRYSSFVTRHSSLLLGTVTTGNLLRHFLAPCSPSPSIHFFPTGVVHAGRTGGPAGEGPTLIIVGKGEEGTPGMMHRPLPI